MSTSSSTSSTNSATAAATSPPADPSDVERNDPFCRVCWVGEVDEPGGKLLAPCRCKGGCEFIHVRCLARWLSSAAAAGKPRRARARCELCGSRWNSSVRSALRALRGPRRSIKALAGDAGKLLARAARGGASAVASAARKMKNEPADAALSLYAVALAARGLASAARGAAAGVVVGGRAGLSSARRAVAYADLLPEAVVAGWMLPSLQAPLTALARGLAVTAGLELVLPVAAGAYVGAVLGFGTSVVEDVASHANAVARATGGVARGLSRMRRDDAARRGVASLNQARALAAAGVAPSSSSSPSVTAGPPASFLPPPPAAPAPAAPAPAAPPSSSGAGAALASFPVSTGSSSSTSPQEQQHSEGAATRRRRHRSSSSNDNNSNNKGLFSALGAIVAAVAGAASGGAASSG